MNEARQQHFPRAALAREVVLHWVEALPHEPEDHGELIAATVHARNISALGMMAEGVVLPGYGARVEVELPGIGVVDALVAWVEDTRCGLAFLSVVDPALLPPVGDALAAAQAPRRRALALAAADATCSPGRPLAG